MATAAVRLTIFSVLLFGLPGDAQERESKTAGTELLTLRSKIFENTRTIRVWLPPNYFDASQKERRYPVFYFTDGIAPFHGRQLDRVANEFSNGGKMPPTI